MVSGMSLIVAPLSSEGCVASPNGDKNFPPQVEKFVVDISGEAQFTTEIFPSEIDTAGRVLVPGIPPGAGLVLNLYGCDAGNEVIWSGRYSGLEVKANSKAAPPLYFTRKNEMSCTGGAYIDRGAFTSALERPLMMHNTARVGDDLLIFGGFDTYIPTGSAPALEATATDIVRYDATRGVFQTLPYRLASPRALAHAVTLGNGSHVLVFGGTLRAEFAQSPPLRWSDTEEPTPAAEIINLENGTVTTADWDIPNMSYSAVAANAAGTRILIAGGMDTTGYPTATLQWLTGTPNSIASGTATRIQGDLIHERMGATAHVLADTESAIVIGGALNANPDAMVEIVTSDATSVPISLDPIPGTFALHASEIIAQDGCQYAVALVGGVDIQRADPNPPLFRSPVGSTPRLHILQLNICDPNAPTATLTDSTAALGGTTLSQRIFHQLVQLEPGVLALSGGINQVGQPIAPADPACDVDTVGTGCWLRDVTILQAGGGVNNPTLEKVSEGQMSAARFGHRSVRLPNDTLLFIGGMNQLSPDADSITNAAEIYNALLPIDSGRCQEAR